MMSESSQWYVEFVAAELTKTNVTFAWQVISTKTGSKVRRTASS